MSQFRFSSRTNQTHPVHICSPHHIHSHGFHRPAPKFHKSYENMHTMDLLRLGKNSSYYYTFLPPQVYPVLRIIHELKGISQAEKPSYMTWSLLKWTSRKRREEKPHKYPLIRDFSVVCYTVLFPKNSSTKFTPECQ